MRKSDLEMVPLWGPPKAKVCYDCLTFFRCWVHKLIRGINQRFHFLPTCCMVMCWHGLSSCIIWYRFVSTGTSTIAGKKSSYTPLAWYRFPRLLLRQCHDQVHVQPWSRYVVVSHHLGILESHFVCNYTEIWITTRCPRIHRRLYRNLGCNQKSVVS